MAAEAWELGGTLGALVAPLSLLEQGAGSLCPSFLGPSGSRPPGASSEQQLQKEDRPWSCLPVSGADTHSCLYSSCSGLGHGFSRAGAVADLTQSLHVAGTQQESAGAWPLPPMAALRPGARSPSRMGCHPPFLQLPLLFPCLSLELFAG